MPYQIKKHGTKYSVMNTQTHKVFSRATSKKKATAQVKLLYGIEHGTIIPHHSMTSNKMY